MICYSSVENEVAGSAIKADKKNAWVVPRSSIGTSTSTVSGTGTVQSTAAGGVEEVDVKEKESERVAREREREVLVVGGGLGVAGLREIIKSKATSTTPGKQVNC